MTLSIESCSSEDPSVVLEDQVEIQEVEGTAAKLHLSRKLYGFSLDPQLYLYNQNNVICGDEIHINKPLRKCSVIRSSVQIWLRVPILCEGA